MMMKVFSVLVAFLCVEHALGFAATKPLHQQKSSSLASSKNDSDNHFLTSAKTTAASVVAAAFLCSNILAVEPAFAADDSFAGSSTELLAGRSGGRMGGRSSMGSRAAPSRSYSRSTTTVVRPMVSSPVILAPSPFGFGSPFGGFGMGYGLGSMGGGYRDYGQDREIARDRSELEEAKYRELQLEQRIAQLEAGSRLQQPPQALPQQEAPAEASK